jgi:hypothetical protein
MPSAFDRFMPRTRLQLPDGAVLSVGTLSCDDQIYQAVYLAYTPAGSSTPTMELELPPKSVEVIIRELQEHANQARFVNGERMLEYPKPYPEAPAGASQRKRKARRHKKKTGQRDAAPNGSPAMPPGNSAVAEGPPSVSCLVGR